MTRASFIHRFGYTAAMAAAATPAHQPATRTATRPIIATVTIPTTVITSRCQGTGSSTQLTAARTSGVSGPCSADGPP
jgi:hypothetical protein